MLNELLQRENQILREHLQALESRQRQVLRALDAFREHLMTVGISAPIIDIAALLAELDCIRRRLGGEVQR
jgi:hypothetical protein